MKTIRIAAVLLALAVTAQATPVSIEEMLAQDPQQPTGTVTIIETQECCEDKGGVPWWPFLFAGAIPLAFIDHDDSPRVDIQSPAITTPTPDTTPVPEPQTLSLGLLAVAGLFLKRQRCWFRHKWTPPRGKCMRCGKWPKNWRQEIPVTIQGNSVTVPSFEVPSPFSEEN